MRNPFRGRMCCDADPDQVSAVEPDDDEGLEQVETDGWNNEQVHGGDVRRVVPQEGPPSLAGRPTPFDHVSGDAGPRDLKPELERFAVNAWRAPKRVFDVHPPDQRAQFRVDPRSPSRWAPNASGSESRPCARGQDGRNETEQPDHSASLGDSIPASTRTRFSVHTGPHRTKRARHRTSLLCFAAQRSTRVSASDWCVDLSQASIRSIRISLLSKLVF